MERVQFTGNRRGGRCGVARSGSRKLSHCSGCRRGALASTSRHTKVDGCRSSALPHLDDNSGQTLVDIDLDGDVSFDGALIEGNSVSGPLFDSAGPNAENLVIAASTIAGNSIGAGQAVVIARNACAIEAGGYRGTHLYRSIVWQPGRALLTMAGTPDPDCFQFLLGNDLGALPASTLNGVGDPRFVDPAAGNYRLQRASPALDFALAQPANSTRDIAPRVIDDPGVSNEFGPHDLGAYEIDRIFAHGFE